jgi:ribosomal-protein-serine acetyltransferase
VTQLPERIDGEEIVVRRWLVRDAESQHLAITESVEHLRPWMPWMADEPQPLQQRRAMLARWDEEWAAGGDAYYAVLVGGVVAGSCGLHRRLGPDALEIGFWIHPSFTRQGLATRVAAMLTGAAFSLPEISRVEIHHDRANAASSGVPRRLGYEFVGERPDDATAPANTGVECVWRMTRSRWQHQLS